MSVVDNKTVDGVALTDDKKGIILLEKQYKDIYQDMSIMYGIIEIHFLHCLTKNAEKFLHSVNNQLNELGIKIQYSVLQGEDNEVR